MSEKQVAVVAGATGITGRHCVERLCAEGWTILALSRRQLDIQCDASRVTQLHVDLKDRAQVEEAIRQARGSPPPNKVVHVRIYHCAYLETGDPNEDCAQNAAMLRNVVEAVESVGGELRHVFTMQGTKWYGMHLATPLKTPFDDERDARVMPPNFYYDLEDYLASRVKGGAPWAWSALRPNPVCGYSSGSYMNLTASIAVYASVCKELGLPLRFPGTATAYRSINEVCDARLLADAMLFTSTHPDCANQGFNVSNGDAFRWEHIWPAIAGWFGMEVAPPVALQLEKLMADKGEVWGRLVKRHGLKALPYEKLATWKFADFVFAQPGDWLSNTVKLRRAGFQGMTLDTERMFLEQFEAMRQDKVIP